MSEIDFIDRLKSITTHPAARGLADDVAMMPFGRHKLVMTHDMMVEGVHFPHHYDPEKLGWRSLAVAASDLAAMGADPVCFTLALTLPDADPDWLSAYAHGLASAARRFGLSLAGGDTTRGPLTLSVQVHGTVPKGGAILRSGAQVGDYICVSGMLGEAGAALDHLENNDPGPDVQAVLRRYHFPCLLYTSDAADE